MKARPILFQGDMIRAILAGRKTQTRRLVNPQPDEDGLSKLKYEPFFEDTSGRVYECKFGAPGDQLWVRETWSGPYRSAPFKPRDMGGPVWYWADGNPDHGDWTIPIPSIHMPRWASRITLRITGVRVERLKEIRSEDCFAEGIDEDGEDYYEGEKFQAAGSQVPAERYAYKALWESINGYGSWDANPWVWVIEFERVTGKA